MISPASKNLSHRHLISQKTNELYYYHQCIGKSNKNFSSRAADLSHHTKNDKQHQTSINLDRSDDSNTQKKLAREKMHASRENFGEIQGNRKPLRNLMNLRKRSNHRNYKSVEPLPPKKPSLTKIQTSFSVRKLSKNQITPSHSQPKLASMQSLQLPQSSKKIETFELPILKSQTDLKMTLKKTSTSKLKLKVKDPFEKRMKLDMEFNDESMIQKLERSMISTLNQEEFRQILGRMQ